MDFSGNGLGVVQPQSCTVTETLNGEWELTLVHPIDEYGKWTRLSEGNILRAPVPAAMTPRIRISVPGEDTRRDVYQVDTDTPEASVRGGTLRLRTGPGEGYSVLRQYANGTEVQVLSKTNAQWYEVVLPDGKRGYMSTTFLRYVRTEGSVSEAVNAVVDARQLRDQPFRIYRVVPELSKVTVYARHIFYDLLDNMVKSLRPSPSAVGASVVQGLSSACLSEHGFTFYSDLTSTAQDVSLENVNPVEALLGEGGLAEKYGGELTRDWFDVFLVRRVGMDSDVQIREGKNLTGISYDVDETDVVTRIMPTGEDADGNILYLPELYIDSPNIDAYTHPKWIHLAVSEAREVTDGDTPKSKDQCYAELRKAAQTEYENGCDLPTVTLKVDFVNCADTEEYRQYGFLQNIFLGDSVRVVARRIGVEVSLRMTQYTYDCLTQKYTAVTLGTAADTLEGSLISARQLASGSITGMKLALNSVGSGQLQSGSVGSLQIKNAAIRGAHIQDACITRAHIAEALIDTLSVNALTAVTSKIKELAAGSVTTDDLYASVAMIAAAQLTTANIVSADIQWADIEALTASIAQISKAQITAAAIDEANIDWAAITTLTAATAEIVKAQMRTADIDWSHIKDLATDTAIITQGTAGELYIARLAVTEANMVSLTVGELVVKGSDGHFYALSVDEGGQVVTTLKQIANDDVADQSIDGGETIIEGTITAGTLNVQDIFADNAVIRSLIAANLDVDTLFAREATVAALSAMDITSNTYLKLMVSGKADQEELDALGQRMTSAEQKITPQAITATVAASASFVHEKYEGRNYCLGSGGEFAFLSNRYYEDGKATSLTLKSLAVSDDFFAHSQNGASIRISLDIRRQGVEASEAATPGVYSGLWVYYLYSENGQFKTVGRGWYLRTTDASFQATDDGWVRLQYGPLDLSPYNPVSISYFALGTSAANGMTGNVWFRNVKLEVLDAWTDWSAAPEDIYGLAGRMDSAESRITQNASNIALKVSTSLYNTEKVYRSSTAPTTLYANMLWLDTSLSPPILKRYTGSAWAAVGAQELKTSGITIGGNNVAITTENFLLQLLDPANNENVLMEMSASGDVGFQALYADEVVSPSVVNAYTGPATLYVYPALSGMAANACRSLREALSRINGKALRYDVTVTFFTSQAETLYEMEGVEISGVTGPHTLRIEGMDRNKTLSTFLTVSSCTARIELSYLNIRDCRGLVGGTSKNSYLINARNNAFLSLTGCVLDLNNVTSNALQATASYVDLRYCEILSAYIGLGLESATGNLYYCKGQCTFSVFCMSGIAFCTGTVPSGGRTSSCNGQIFDAGVTTDAGTSVAPQTPDDTTLQYATLTKSYRGGWRTDTVDVVQGAYSEAGYSAGLSWNYGCMWFGGLRGVLSGKTVKSATLTLYRKTGSGSGAARTLYLCAITNTTASGAPAVAANYGAIGTIGRAEQMTFAIPPAVAEGLANGTFGGLCLYESPYNFGASNWSANYMRIAGTDSSYKPCLRVIYGGTAAG